MSADAGITRYGRMTAGVTASIITELKKFRRSKILWITALAFLVITIICGFFMYILKDPEQARSLGLVGAKAQIFGGTADWSNYFNLILVLISIAGLIVFGFIFTWIFGREFSNRTVYDLLALPTSRTSIVLAKIIIAASWSMVLIVAMFLFMLVIGAILDLPGGNVDIIFSGLGKMLVTSILSIPLCIPFGLVASVTRGYLPSVGCIFLIIVLVQVIDTIGYGLYFPWSIPAMYSGAASSLTGAEPVVPGPISYILVALVGIISILISGLWWRNADQT